MRLGCLINKYIGNGFSLSQEFYITHDFVNYEHKPFTLTEGTLIEPVHSFGIQNCTIVGFRLLIG